VKNDLHKKIFWIIIFISFLGLFFTPFKPIFDELKRTLPWVASGILLSEILLTAGFITMISIATPAFFISFKKSLKIALYDIMNIKSIVGNINWTHVANKCNSSVIFWLGFWISVIGACGDGIILILAIGKSLPIQSWGLMIIPFWDLGLTYMVRKAIYTGVKK
jgi:hypothetical protein